MRGNRKNEIGNRYDRLEVKEYAGVNEYRKLIWLCKCDCGNKVVVIGSHLRSGNTRSCGCYMKERILEVNKGHSRTKGQKNGRYKHGESGTKEYICARTAKRKAAKKNQTPDNANLDKIQLYYTICAYLNKPCEIPMWHVDHIKPISKCGLHHEDNLQILTAELNMEKKAKYPLTVEEEIKYKGYRI